MESTCRANKKGRGESPRPFSYLVAISPLDPTGQDNRDNEAIKRQSFKSARVSTSGKKSLSAALGLRPMLSIAAAPTRPWPSAAPKAGDGDGKAGGYRNGGFNCESPPAAAPSTPPGLLPSQSGYAKSPPNNANSLFISFLLSSEFCLPLLCPHPLRAAHRLMM